MTHNLLWEIVPQKGDGLKDSYPMFFDFNFKVDLKKLQDEYINYWEPLVKKDPYYKRDISYTPFFKRYTDQEDYHDNLLADNFIPESETGFLNDKFRQYQLFTRRPGTKGKHLWDWTYPKDSFYGTYIEELLNLFKSPVIRPRFSYARPGCNPGYHIDYDNPKRYAFRIHLPIFTNDNMIMSFENNSKIIDLHMKKGIFYFTNISFNHNIFNGGNTERIQLVFDLMSDIDFPDDQILKWLYILKLYIH